MRATKIMQSARPTAVAEIFEYFRPAPSEEATESNPSAPSDQVDPQTHPVDAGVPEADE